VAEHVSLSGNFPRFCTAGIPPYDSRATPADPANRPAEHILRSPSIAAVLPQPPPSSLGALIPLILHSRHRMPSAFSRPAPFSTVHPVAGCRIYYLSVGIGPLTTGRQRHPALADYIPTVRMRAGAGTHMNPSIGVRLRCLRVTPPPISHRSWHGILFPTISGAKQSSRNSPIGHKPYLR